jgi:hypothetical protein
METYYQRNKEYAKEKALSYYWLHREERREWFKKYYIDVLKPRRQEERLKRKIEREQQKMEQKKLKMEQKMAKKEEKKSKPVKQIITVEKKPINKSGIVISYLPITLSFD